MMETAGRVEQEKSRISAALSYSAQDGLIGTLGRGSEVLMKTVPYADNVRRERWSPRSISETPKVGHNFPRGTGGMEAFDIWILKEVVIKVGRSISSTNGAGHGQKGTLNGRCGVDIMSLFLISMIVHSFLSILPIFLVPFRGHESQDQCTKTSPSGHVQTRGVTSLSLKAMHIVFAV